MTRWVGTHVAAKACGVSSRTIQRYCEDGFIPPGHAHRTKAGEGHWRIDYEHVLRIRMYLEQNRTNRTSQRRVQP